MKLKVAVLNLQSGIGVTKGYQQYLTHGWRYVFGHAGKPVANAAKMLSEEEPDIAILTEIDEPSRRTKFTSHVSILTENSPLTHSAFFPTKSYGTSIQEGSAVLSSQPFSEITTHALTTGINPRVLGHTKVFLNDSTLHVYAAHLALGGERRKRQAHEIGEILKKRTGPVLLGGDFNERGPALIESFGKLGLTAITEPSYPSWRPRHSLQALFVSKDITVIRSYQPRDPHFSDHIPLIVELEI